MIHVGGSEGRIAGATHIARRLQPRRHAAHRARQRARHPHARGGAPLRAEAAAHLAVARHQRLQHGGGLDARRRQRVRSASAARPELGTKAEIKNMNCFKALHDGLALRDRPAGRARSKAAAASSRRRVTTTWRAKRTSSLRSKEEAHDYRYFPEPDMVPFEFTEEFIDEIRGALARASRRRAARFMADFGLPRHDATVLTEDLDLAEFFEAAVDHRRARAREGDQQRACSTTSRRT